MRKRSKSIRKSKSTGALHQKDVEIGSVISSGTYGIVKRGIVKEYGQEIECVLKVIDITKEFSLEDFEREVMLLGGLLHPNIIRIHSYYTFNSFKFENKLRKVQGVMVLEKCNEENLSYKIHNYIIDDKEKLQISIKLAETILFLHERNIIHRDIKPDNVLFGLDDQIKLCDFGNSKKKKNIRNSLSGTAEYVDPEMMTTFKLNVDHRKFDIYSFGILLWELWSQCMPYSDYKEQHKEDYQEIIFLFHVFNDNIRPDIKKLKGYPKKIVKLIKKCWQRKHSERPKDFKEIHKILSKVKL